MNLEGNKVILRAIEIEDLPYLQKISNDPLMERCVIGYSFPISSEDQLYWYRNSIVGNKTDLKFVVADKLSNEIFGLATLGNFDWKNRTAFHGIKLGSEAQGKGFGKDTVMTIMKYAFEEFQLNRLDGGGDCQDSWQF